MAKRFLQNRKHLNHRPCIQLMMNTIATTFADMDADSAARPVVETVKSDARADLIAQASKMDADTQALAPRSKGGDDGKPWHDGWTGGSDAAIRAFLSNTIDKLPQGELEALANALIKDCRVVSWM